MRGCKYILLTTLTAACAAPCALAEPVAVVNGEPIPRREFAMALVQAFGRASIGPLVNRELVKQEARRKGVSVNDQEVAPYRDLLVELSIRQDVAALRIGPDEFEALSKPQGWTLDDLREKHAGRLKETEVRVQLLVRKLLEPEMDLSEDALRRYFAQTRGRRYSAAHIEVMTQAEARKLRDVLEGKPERWVAAAAAYSLDRDSLRYSGRFPLATADSELGRLLAGMRPGEMNIYHDGVRWHLLMFVNTVSETGEDFEDVEDELRAELAILQARKMLNPLLARLNAKSEVVLNLSAEPAERAVLGQDVAAWVNGESIPVARLADALVREYGPAVLPRCIERELILQEARRRGVTAGDAEVDERMARTGAELFTARAYGQLMTAEQLEEVLSQVGTTAAEEYRQRLLRACVQREDILAMLLAEKMVRDEVTLTEREIEQVVREFQGQRLLVRELVAPDAEVARGLHTALLAGTSFDVAARSSRAQPGVWTGGGLPLLVTSTHPFYRRLKDLREGQISNVLERDGQYCIIKVLKRRPAVAESDDPGSLRRAAEQEALQRKVRSRIRALLVKLRAEAVIETTLD